MDSNGILSRRATLMHIPVVLEKIAGSLPAADLLKLRSGCNQWNLSFIPQLKRKHKPIVVGCIYTFHTEKVFDRFQQCMKSSNMVPFGKYIFINCTKSNWLDCTAACGESITSLKIEWLCKENLSAILSVMAEQAPNLVKLELYLTEFVNGYRERKEPHGSELEIKTFPNLRRFTLHHIGGLPVAYRKAVRAVIQSAPSLVDLRLPGPVGGIDQFKCYSCDLPKAFAQIRDFGVQVRQLKHLEIGPVKLQTLQILIELASQERGHNVLSLDSFFVELTDEVIDTELQDVTLHFHSFLSTQASTLKKLTIVVQPRKSTTQLLLIAFPRIERLEVLTITPAEPVEIHRYDDFQLCFDFQDGFASCFPAMKQLKLRTKPGGELNLQEQEQLISHHGVTDLSLEVNISDLSILPTLFPSVSRLELCVHVDKNPETLSSIWTLWPGLTRLKLEVPLSLNVVRPDDFLSGVPRDQVRNLKSRLESHVWPTLNVIREIAVKYKSKPGITDLSQLQEFELDWYDGRITDIGGYLGLFLSASNRPLQRVSLGPRMVSQFSDECLSFLGNVCSPNAVFEHDGHSLSDDDEILKPPAAKKFVTRIGSKYLD